MANSTVPSYEINYKTEDFELTDTLIVLAQVEYEGEMYKVTDVDLTVEQGLSPGGSNEHEYRSLPNIEKIIYPNTVERIYFENGDESNYNFGGSCKKQVILSNNLKSIPDYFFATEYITSLEIPDSVTSIGDYAFRYCSSLQNITIQGEVESIRDNAFTECTILNKITINREKGSFDFSRWNLPEGTTIVWNNGQDVVKNQNNLT